MTPAVTAPRLERKSRAITDPTDYFEQFPALSAIPRVRHGFTLRVPGIDVAHEKAVALRHLDGVHHEIREALGVAEIPFITAQQVH